jgi:hypothetical protein
MEHRRSVDGTGGGEGGGERIIKYQTIDDHLGRQRHHKAEEKEGDRQQKDMDRSSGSSLEI